MKRFDFNSLGDFARACQKLPPSWRRNRDSAWAGEPYEVTLDRCGHGGSTACVADAQRLIDRIQASMPETLTRRWSRDCVGAFPCVPAFLSGEPESMWMMADTPMETSPVRIYVSICCSASVDYRAMQRRGAAILALVLIVSRTRAVELFTYSDWAESTDGVGDTVLSFRLPSHPMMLSEVAWALTTPALMRNLGFDYLSHAVPTIESSFPWGAATVADRRRGGPAQRKLLALDEQDVLIGPVYTTDPLITDPIGFVHRELAKLGLTE